MRAAAHSLHALEAILDSHLDYWAACECFVAKCPNCKDGIVLEVGVAGGVSMAMSEATERAEDIGATINTCHSRLWSPTRPPSARYDATAAGPGCPGPGPNLSFPGADLAQLARLAQDSDANTRHRAVELLGVAGRHDRDQAVEPPAPSIA